MASTLTEKNVQTVPESGFTIVRGMEAEPIAISQPGDNPTSESHFMVDHVCVMTDRRFEDVAKQIDQQLGRFDPDVYAPLAAGGDPGKVTSSIEALAGSSGLMLFATHDHGSLLRIAGEKRKAIQYIVGNPAFAVQMTQHDRRASLYAPLRVLLYENDEGTTCLEYDKPSSLFGQFENTQVNAVATMLDRKLEALATEAFRQERDSG